MELTRSKQNVSVNDAVPFKPIIKEKTELHETAYPLLIAYLHALRKHNLVHNKMDELNESAYARHKYNYTCEHNLLFFLLTTEQFKKIRELFQNHKAELARAYMVLHYIKKRRHHKKRAANHHFFQHLNAANDELSRAEHKNDESAKLAKNPHLFFNNSSLDTAQRNQGWEYLVDPTSLDYAALPQVYH